MSFNIPKAITFNKNKYSSMKTVGIIQARLNCATGGVFNEETVTAIYNWQKSPNRTTNLDADGKLGALSLGVMISDMEKVGLNADAQVLRQYPFNLPTAGGGETVGDVNPISSFFQYTSSPMVLRQDPSNPARWMMKGRFRVSFQLNPLLVDHERYEYRQYIKGSAFTQKGYWNPEKTIWTAKSGEPKTPANEFFAVPGGIDPVVWKEDGQVVAGNKIEQFGHRDVQKTNLVGIKDMYSPNQKGRDYILEDTFGLEGNSDRGLRVGVALYYRGVVVKDKTTEIFSKSWGYNNEEAIKWID